MGRRAAGIVLLVAVIVTVLASTRLTTTGVIGAASVDPGEPPPVVGTCLRDAVQPEFDPGGWMRPLPGLATVDCARTHWGEVYALLDDPVPDAQGRDQRLARCFLGDGLVSYLAGRPELSAEWQSALRYDVVALSADRQQYAGGQRWVACVMHGVEPFVGSLAGVAADDAPPPSLGLCYQDEFAAFDARDTPCGNPHRGEVFAFRTLDVAAPPTQAELDSWCDGVVGTATGGADLAAFAVQPAVFAWFQDVQSRFVKLPLPDGTKGATAMCGVRVAGDRSLVGSLRRVGDGPLPWAG